LESVLYEEQRILQEGEILHLPASGKDGQHLKYGLEMFEPISQGYAQRQTTKVILLLSNDEVSKEFVPDTLQSNGIESDLQDVIEIDEEFLARSVFGQNMKDDSVTFSTSSGTSPGFLYKGMSTFFKPLEEDSTMYLRTAALGRIGIQSGDWVGDTIQDI